MAIIKCKECGGEVSTKAKECPKCGAVVKRKTSAVTWLLVILFALCVGYIASGPSTTTTSLGSSSAKSQASVRDVAIKETKLDFSWSKAGFENIMEANFTIQNKSRYDIKDITITCVHSAKSGTVIDTNKQTIYDVVKVNSTKKFQNVNMGFIHSQAHSSSCYISDLIVS